MFKTVKKQGGNFSSLGAAVKAIPQDLVSRNESWIIEVQDDGPYIESTVIISQKTDANHTITIRNQTGKTPVLMPTPYSSGFRVRYTKYVTIDGFKIIGQYKANGVFIEGSQYITVQNCTILNSDTEGIVLYGSHNSNIHHNRIYSCRNGIHCYYYSQNNIIENNTIYHQLGNGIVLNRNAKYNQVRRNLLFNNPNAIKIESNTGEGNRFEDNILASGPRSQYLYYFSGNIPFQTLSNFNTLYAPSSKIAFVSGNSYSTLSQWQTTSQDLNSTIQDPLLASLDASLFVT
ncbi:MAG: right-handed parallel beta-helix repeat-containing protein [Deltaproteobacteria bacterium]|nr:right-handed parallel beta-helix repeat-containing protein [Deltaproteobacteria bacterium]